MSVSEIGVIHGVNLAPLPKEASLVTPMLYAMRPKGPELTRRALLRRLRQHGVRVVALPAGHYILGNQRPLVDRVVAEINADLLGLSVGDDAIASPCLDILYRPIPGPTDGVVE